MDLFPERENTVNRMFFMKAAMNTTDNHIPKARLQDN